MAETTESLQESEFVKLLLRSKVLSEAQLKAVYDYQRSVGGSVIDILVKLNMMSRRDLDATLQAAMRGEDVATALSGRTNLAIDASKLEMEGLKLHYRLIDKIPPEIIEQFLLVVFFPVRGLDSRKLIVGHGRELPEEVLNRVRSILGVDLYTLPLAETVAADFVVKYLERSKRSISDQLRSLATKRREESAEAPPRPESPAERAEHPADRSPSDADGPAVNVLEEEDSSEESARESPQLEDSRSDTRDTGEFDPAYDDRSTQDSTRGVSRLMNSPEPSKDSDSVFGVSNLEWTALLNLLVKKRVLTREEVRVEIELLKRNKTRF